MERCRTHQREKLEFFCSSDDRTAWRIDLFHGQENQDLEDSLKNILEGLKPKYHHHKWTKSTPIGCTLSNCQPSKWYFANFTKDNLSFFQTLEQPTPRKNKVQYTMFSKLFTFLSVLIPSREFMIASFLTFD